MSGAPRLTRLGLLLAIWAALALAACQNAPVEPGPADAGAGPAKSMKGWELYSWQDQGEWRYTLAVGTNRLKTAEEITSGGASEAFPVLAGDLEALKAALAALPEGEEVFWSAPEAGAPGTGDGVQFEFPPADVVQDLEETGRLAGVRLQIVDRP